MTLYILSAGLVFSVALGITLRVLSRPKPGSVVLTITRRTYPTIDQRWRAKWLDPTGQPHDELSLSYAAIPAAILPGSTDVEISLITMRLSDCREVGCENSTTDNTDNTDG